MFFIIVILDETCLAVVIDRGHLLTARCEFDVVLKVLLTSEMGEAEAE